MSLREVPDIRPEATRTALDVPCGSETPDADLVAAARAGQREAFEELVQRYQGRAVSVAWRLLGDRHDAAEAAQEAFLKAWRALPTLSEPARFGSWLLRIVGNLSLNLRRARKYRRAASLSGREAGEAERESPLHPADPRTEAVDAGLRGEELERAIRAALDRLPEKQRLALVLFSIEGLPQREVAEIMDCSVELVKWNVFAARRTLRGLLANYIDG